MTSFIKNNVIVQSMFNYGSKPLQYCTDNLTLEKVRYAVETIRNSFDNPYKRSLLKELSIEIIRTAGLGVLASSIALQKADPSDPQAADKNMATAIMIAPLLANIIGNSLSNIGRKACLLVSPFMVNPSIRKAAEYREKFDAQKHLYTPSMQEFMDQMLTRYAYYLEYHNYDVKEISTALEEVLFLPHYPKQLERRNPKVVNVLQHYSPSVKEQMARILSEICSHSYIQAPSKRIIPVILVGPPGTGKTFLVRQIAAALELPLCEIKISEYRSITGKNMWSNDPEMGVVLDALLESKLKDPAKLPANIILFIDEIDKVLKRGEHGSFSHPSGNAVHTFLHGILEAGMLEFPIERYCNATHSIRHVIVMLGANRSFSDVLGEEDSVALESRVRTVDFSEGFDIERKKAIIAKFIEDANHEYESDLQLQDDPVIAKILEKDEELKLKGVRILLDVVGQYVQSLLNKEEISYFLGEEPKPFDVDAAYSKYLPPKKKASEREECSYIA